MASSCLPLPTELLDCVICFRRLKEPKTLQCQHSFCGQCLANIICVKIINKDGEVVLPDQAQTSIICPICNKEHKNIQSINSLEPCLFLKQVLDAIPQSEDSGSARRIERCFACERTGQLVVCIQCKIFVCKRCHNDGCHKIADCKAHGHQFLTKTKREDELMYCCLDHNLATDFYCADCKQIICLDCLLTSHRGHHILTTKSISDDVKILSSQLKSSCQVYEKSLEELNKKQADGLIEIEKKLQQNLKHVDDMQLKILGYLCNIFEDERKRIREGFKEEKEIYLASTEALAPSEIKANSELYNLVNSIQNYHHVECVAQKERLQMQLAENEKQMKSIEAMTERLAASRMPKIPFDTFNIESLLTRSHVDCFLKQYEGEGMVRSLCESGIVKELFSAEVDSEASSFKDKVERKEEQERPDSDNGDSTGSYSVAASTEACRKIWLQIHALTNTVTEQQLKRNIEKFTGPDSVDVVLISAEWQTAFVIFSSQDDANVLCQSGISFDGKRPKIWMPSQYLQELWNSIGWRNISGGKVIYITNFGDRTSANELQGVLEQHTGINSVEKVSYEEGNWYALSLLKDTKAVKKLIRRSISLNGKKLKILDFAEDWMPVDINW